jgi:hypothetical protein
MGVSLIYILYRTIKGRPVERRIVFLYIGMGVLLPLMMTVAPPLPVTTDVQKMYDHISKLPPGSKILCAFDFDPPSAPELQPMAVAFVKWAFKRDLKLIIMGLWPQGPQQANMALEEAFEDPAVAAKPHEQGVDWVNLGFQSGNEFVILSMGTEFKRMFPRDTRLIPYDSIPILKNVVNFSNVDFIMNFGAGYPGTREWVQIGVDRYKSKLGAGTTAVQATEVYPYLSSGQLVGLLGGMSGAAEFEKVLDEKGKASTFILAQMFGHATVMAFVIIGNIAYFMLGRKKKEE